MYTKKIEKFIGENRYSKIVYDLFEANEQRNRPAFALAFKKIRECIDLQDHIKHIECSIKYHSISIKELKETKNEYKEQLRQLRDDDIAKSDFDLFAEEGLEIDKVQG